MWYLHCVSNGDTTVLHWMVGLLSTACYRDCLREYRCMQYFCKFCNNQYNPGSKNIMYHDQSLNQNVGIIFFSYQCCPVCKIDFLGLPFVESLQYRINVYGIDIVCCSGLVYFLLYYISYIMQYCGISSVLAVEILPYTKPWTHCILFLGTNSMSDPPHSKTRGG